MAIKLQRDNAKANPNAKWRICVQQTRKYGINTIIATTPDPAKYISSIYDAVDTVHAHGGTIACERVASKSWRAAQVWKINGRWLCASTFCSNAKPKRISRTRHSSWFVTFRSLEGCNVTQSQHVKI